MPRFLTLLGLVIATCLLMVGPASSLCAAETNSLAPSSDRPAAAPRAEIIPVTAPAPAPTATEAAKAGFFSKLSSAVCRIFTFKRGSSPSAGSPPAPQSQPQVVVEYAVVPPPDPNLGFSLAPAPVGTPLVESVVVTPASPANGLKRNRGPAGSVPALVAGALPNLRSEAQRSRSPNLSRQARLDMDQRIERLGPELEPVSGSELAGSASLSTDPVVAGIEETVLTLEAASVLQSKGAVGVGAGGAAGKITRRSDEIKLIPNDAKQRERFREVSVFFDLPAPKSPKPVATPASSATYEQK